MFDTCILESYTFYSSHLFSLCQRSVWFKKKYKLVQKVILGITKLKNFKRSFSRETRTKLGQIIVEISKQVLSDLHYGTTVIPMSFSILYFVL